MNGVVLTDEMFFTAIRDGVKNNLTLAEVAQGLGVDLKVCQSRLSVMRKLLKENNPQLAAKIKLRDGRKDKKKSDKTELISQIVAAFDEI